jgi:hypothetical protein
MKRRKMQDKKKMKKKEQKGDWIREEQELKAAGKQLDCVDAAEEL